MQDYDHSCTYLHNAESVHIPEHNEKQNVAKKCEMMNNQSVYVWQTGFYIRLHW